MDDTALREAMQRLLDHGEAAEDSKLTRMAAAKKGPAAAPESCPECEAPLVEGKCAKCGYSKPEEAGEDESELAGLLEQGAAEG